MCIPSFLHNFQELIDVLCNSGPMDEDVGNRLRMMGDNTYNKPIICIADIILSADEGSDEEYFYLHKLIPIHKYII